MSALKDLPDLAHTLDERWVLAVPISQNGNLPISPNFPCLGHWPGIRESQWYLTALSDLCLAVPPKKGTMFISLDQSTDTTAPPHPVSLVLGTKQENTPASKVLVGGKQVCRILLPIPLPW